MASELRVNTLKDAAGNNSIGMSYVAEGSAKAWCNVDGTATFDSSDTEIRDSFNVGSTVDHANGEVIVSFTSNMNNANYSLSLGAKQTDNSNASGTDTQPSTLAQGSYRIITNNASFAKADCELNFSTVHGDLA